MSPQPMLPALSHDGESLQINNRVVVAPATGVFTPVPDAATLEPGARIQSGQVVGHLSQNGEAVDITSPFDGTARGMLALANERVRQYQPVLWMATG